MFNRIVSAIQAFINPFPQLPKLRKVLVKFKKPSPNHAEVIQYWFGTDNTVKPTQLDETTYVLIEIHPSRKPLIDKEFFDKHPEVLRAFEFQD